MEIQLILTAQELGAKMNLMEDLIKSLPDLTNIDFCPTRGSIHLRDDSDGVGPYIEKWEYTEPIPDGLSLGKP